MADNLFPVSPGAAPASEASTKPQDSTKDETIADYAARRQIARFGQMKQEVDALLQKYPATKEFPAADAFLKELQGLRQRGYDSKEEQAIMHTFAVTHGERTGNLSTALNRYGGEEWQGQRGEAPGGAPTPGGADILYNRPDSPLPPGAGMPPGPERPYDDQVRDRLFENWTKSGRLPNYVLGKDKQGRPMYFRDPKPGFKT